jgi:hypothetical protein
MFSNTYQKDINHTVKTTTNMLLPSINNWEKNGMEQQLGPEKDSFIYSFVKGAAATAKICLYKHPVKIDNMRKQSRDLIENPNMFINCFNMTSHIAYMTNTNIGQIDTLKQYIEKIILPNVSVDHIMLMILAYLYTLTIHIVEIEWKDNCNSPSEIHSEIINPGYPIVYLCLYDSHYTYYA